MGTWQRRWSVVLAMVIYSQAALAEDEPAAFGDSNHGSMVQKDEAADAHHRSRRQLLDGWSPLRDALSTLENVDDLLRTTVPEVDQLNCLERFMCEMSSGSIMNGINELLNPTTPVPLLPMPQPIAQFPNHFQQPHPQAHPSQQFHQPPQHGFPPQGHPQGHPQSIPQHGFQQQPQHAFPPQAHPQSIPQQGLQQHPQHSFPPQAHPQQGFQQPPQHSFPPQGHPQSHPQQGFQHQPAFPTHIDPSQVQQTFDPTFQQGGFVNNPGFEQFPAPQFSQFRETAGDDNTIRREGEAQPLRRRRKKPQPPKNALTRIIENLFGNRKKRSIFPVEKQNSRVLSRNERSLMDTLLNSFNVFSPDLLLRMVDQYMIGQQNSLYPYSHAAMMGYTGTPQRCERMYPKCPTTPDEMIHVFNNIRRYYPDGMPFADQLPWPLRDLFR